MRGLSQRKAWLCRGPEKYRPDACVKCCHSGKSQSRNQRDNVKQQLRKAIVGCNAGGQLDIYVRFAKLETPVVSKKASCQAVLECVERGLSIPMG